jgi:DNA-binding CsgD family transcriptional regulator
MKAPLRSSLHAHAKRVEDYFEGHDEVARVASDRPDALKRLSEIVRWVDTYLHASGYRLSVEPIAPASDRGDLDKRFALTPAETRLATHLLNGGTPATYARKRGLSPHTVRNQLRSIYAKTNTNRQVSLLQLLLNATGKNP